MGAMLETLKGNAVWGAVMIVLAVVGGATYLASQGVLPGSDWLALAILVLTGAVGITSAHTAGQAVASALNTPAPASGPSASPVPVPTNEPLAPPAP